MIEPLYVCVYVPQFPVQALLRLRPELDAAAVAVLAGDAPFEQVGSLNARAAERGVAAGMTRAELENVLALCVLKRSVAYEETARAALLEMAAGFTPRVEVQAVAGPHFAAVLDMTGSARLFGSITETVERIAAAAAALRLPVQLAVSGNFQASVCLASMACDSPIVADKDRAAEALRMLPLSALPLTEQQAETFALWGLQTLGDLARLPEKELVARLGQTGRRLWLLARGEQPHLMVPVEPQFLLREYVAFDAPVEQMESLLFVLAPMIDQLLARAAHRAYALASVEVRLGLDGGAEHVRTTKPALPVASREPLLKLLHLDLQAYPPQAGVLSVRVHAEPGDRSKVQTDLFSPHLPEPARLDVVLARIGALVGEGRAGSPKLLDTHAPDSFVMEPFTLQAIGKVETTPARHTGAMRRMRPPLELVVERKQMRLQGFFCKGKRYTVEEAYGPWRRSGAWWSSAVWSHEEWDVCARTGTDETLLGVVRHDLLRDVWHLAALYD